MASVLMAYGLGLVVLGWVVQQIVPGPEQVTLIASLAGGGLCLLWGVAALAGLKGRAWATVSAIATAFVLLSQVIHVWSVAADHAAGSLAVRVLITLMLMLTVGIVMYLLHGERPPEFYQRGVNSHPNPASRRNAGPSQKGRAAR